MSRSSVWLFGYGSLIWNPGFLYAERRKAVLSGWRLRFWQGSEDHRGTPDQPGRVATLVPDPGGRVVGVAYRLDGEIDDILAYLDYREKGGYNRRELSVETADGPLTAISYIGPPTSREFVGPEDDSLTARIIGAAVGPSGRNVDYLLSLYRALDELGETDPHVESLLSLLKSVG